MAVYHCFFEYTIFSYKQEAYYEQCDPKGNVANCMGFLSSLSSSIPGIRQSTAFDKAHLSKRVYIRCNQFGESFHS